MERWSASSWFHGQLTQAEADSRIQHGTECGVSTRLDCSADGRRPWRCAGTASGPGSFLVWMQGERDAVHLMLSYRSVRNRVKHREIRLLPSQDYLYLRAVRLGFFTCLSLIPRKIRRAQEARPAAVQLDA
jgi:hypothetical protein